MRKFTCILCGKRIKVNYFGFAECGCDYADPRELEAGYAFLPCDLPQAWKPNRYAICDVINGKHEKYLEREWGESWGVTISIGDSYNPE